MTVTLDSTLRIVPVWSCDVQSDEFEKMLLGNEILRQKSLAVIKEFADSEGILFAGVNFLTGDFDYAAILAV